MMEERTIELDGKSILHLVMLKSELVLQIMADEILASDKIDLCEKSRSITSKMVKLQEQ
jgi:hypothetical protein